MTLLFFPHSQRQIPTQTPNAQTKTGNTIQHTLRAYTSLVRREFSQMCSRVSVQRIAATVTSQQLQKCSMKPSIRFHSVQAPKQMLMSSHLSNSATKQILWAAELRPSQAGPRSCATEKRSRESTSSSPSRTSGTCAESRIFEKHKCPPASNIPLHLSWGCLHLRESAAPCPDPHSGSSAVLEVIYLLP